MKIVVRLHTNSSKGPLIELGNCKNELTVYLRERPKDNEANEALIKIIAKHFDVTKSQVRIKSGHKSRVKLLEIL